MKRKHQILKTILIVGEGPQEVAFLKHMRCLFARNTGQKVKIESGDGGSPRSVIEYVVRKRHIAYDARYVLLDTDVSISQEDKAYARDNGIVIFESVPMCLDGMLLDILSKNVPNTSTGCKKKLHSMLSGSATSRESYTSLFGYNLLNDSKKAAIQQIIKVLKNR